MRNVYVDSYVCVWVSRACSVFTHSAISLVVLCTSSTQRAHIRTILFDCSFFVVVHFYSIDDFRCLVTVLIDLCDYIVSGVIFSLWPKQSDKAKKVLHVTEILFCSFSSSIISSLASHNINRSAFLFIFVAESIDAILCELYRKKNLIENLIAHSNELKKAHFKEQQ